MENFDLDVIYEYKLKKIETNKMEINLLIS